LLFALTAAFTVPGDYTRTGWRGFREVVENPAR